MGTPSQLRAAGDERPLRILLVGNYGISRQESMIRFADLMARILEAEGLEVRTVAPSPLLGRLRPSAHGLGKWLGYVDRFLVFPRLLPRQARWADVVHICDHSNAPYVSCAAGRPVVVTCHDLLAVRSALGEFPENPTGWTGRHLQRWIRRGLDRTAHVACVSEATRHDVARLCELPAERVSVVPNALNYAYAPMAPAEAGRRLLALGVDPGRPYLLHVGGNQWYKNRLGVLRIFEAFCRDPRSEHLALVMAGKPFTEALMDFVRAHGLGERVITPGAVYEEDLRALYSRARALLFPSLHEGFGWPVIEAQACGCPVFASNRPPLTEIGGDAAIPIDPEDPSAAAALIAQRLADPDALSDVRQHGRRNAARFSAKAMAAGYLEAYRRAMER